MADQAAIERDVILLSSGSSTGSQWRPTERSTSA